MKIQTQASSVLERTSHYLKVGVLKQKPAWYEIVGAYPPHTNLTKKPKVIDNQAQHADPRESLFKQNSAGFYKTRLAKEDRQQKNNSISRIPKLEFLEDELRDLFYHQHPWEFSRPKTLVESNGNDNESCNWENMLQWSKPLDGESVVQRTIHLLKTNSEQLKSALFEAYDKARFEFYQLRMQEEMNSAVSREESTMYGGIFASTHVDWGVKQEQEYIDAWAIVAQEKTKIAKANEGKNDASMGAALDVVEAEGNMWKV